MNALNRDLLQQLSRLKTPGCPPLVALGVYLDKRDSTQERQVLEAHLQACPACINRLLELRELTLLEQQGAAPPRTLVDRTQRLVPAQKIAHTTAVESVLSRLTAMLVTMAKSVGSWLSSRFLGEITAATAAVFLVLMSVVLFQKPWSGYRDGDEKIKAHAELSLAEQKLLSALMPSGPDPARIALMLKTLSATPVMDKSRGTRDNHVYLKALPVTPVADKSGAASDSQIYNQAVAATVLVASDTRRGTGAVIDKRGEVLTNWHVVRGSDRAIVFFKPAEDSAPGMKSGFAATLVKIDPVADLALLQIQTPVTTLNGLALGRVTEADRGETVYTIGHPDGDAWTYTSSLIDRLQSDYQWRDMDGLLHQAAVIQTRSTRNPGDSGGVLLNKQGELIGINVLRSERFNYAVTVDVIQAFLQQSADRMTIPTPDAIPAAYRIESYGKHIAGVYVGTAVPPPDVWLVYQDSQTQPIYAARGQAKPSHIDTIIQAADPGWQSLVSYVDSDCDGMVDLIGHIRDGAPARYDRPSQPLQLSDLAVELADALTEGAIPYSQMQICQ